MKKRGILLNRRLGRTVLLPLVFSFLIVPFLFADRVQAADQIGISPLSVEWKDHLKQFEITYTVFNDSSTAQEISSIVVFNSGDQRRWRGTAAQMLDANSEKTFNKNIPTYFFLKNDYAEIVVKLYSGKYERFLVKSSAVQNLSSVLTVDDNIIVTLTDKPAGWIEGQKLRKKELVIGSKASLFELMGEDAASAEVLLRVRGREAETSAPEYKLTTGNYLMTVMSNKLTSAAKKEPKKVTLEEKAGVLFIKNPDQSQTLTGLLKNNQVVFLSRNETSMVEFSGQLTADNQVAGKAIQTTNTGMTYTAEFALTQEK